MTVQQVVEKQLANLNRTCFQDIPQADIPKVATALTKAMSFFDGYDAAYLESIDALEFQAVVDFLLFQIHELPDGEKLNFLEHVGHPLTNNEMIRFMFRL